MNEINMAFNLLSNDLSKLATLVEKTISEKTIKRFICNKNGTITDTQTGLIWIQDPSILFINQENRFKWEHAITLCNTLRFMGYNDWRAPSIQEELTLVDYTRGGNLGTAIDINFFKGIQNSYYWTSTSCAFLDEDAWVVDIKTGYSFVDNKTFSHPVHPVRSIK